MKTIFDKTTRDELIQRINSLNENSSSLWGKMNVYQMLMHCKKWEEMALGKVVYNQSFIGLLFGKSALPDFIGDERPFKRNVPTVPALRVKETIENMATLKNAWIQLLEEYDNFQNHNFTHPFFGKMDKEQIGYLAYKHTDHHLRQFKN